MCERMKETADGTSHEFTFYPTDDRDSHSAQSKQEQYYSEFRKVYETAYHVDV